MFLSPHDKAACLQELREVGAAAVQSGRLRPLVETLYAWEATGLAMWDDLQRQERGEAAEENPIEIERPVR